MKLISLLVLITALAFAPGCGTLSTTTYKAVGVSQVTVQTSLKFWDDYIKANPQKVTIAMNDKVRAAFNKWKACQLAVIDAAAAFQASQISTNSATNTASVESIFLGSIQDANAASGDIVSLIQQLTK